MTPFSMARETRAALASGLLALSALYLAMGPREADGDHSAVVAWFEVHVPGMFDLGTLGSGVILIALLGVAAYLVGLAATAVGAWCFQISTPPREASSSLIRSWFWNRKLGPAPSSRPGVGRVVKKLIALPRRNSEDLAREAMGELDSYVRSRTAQLSESDLRRIYVRRTEAGLGKAVFDARARFASAPSDPKSIDVSADEMRDYLVQLVRAECKSPSVEETLEWLSASKFEVIGRHYADALLKAALPLPGASLVITFLLNSDLGGGIVLSPVLGVCAVIGLVGVGVQAIATRQRWQRIAMRAAAEGMVRSSTLAAIDGAGARTGSEQGPVIT